MVHYNDQETRSPGAKFWIPSLDEWLKAVYYDPRPVLTGKNWSSWGWQSEPNARSIWWWHPASSDEPLRAGLLNDGGQTNASYFWFLPNIPLETFEVGAYPHIQTPWGLLDASGGFREWTEEFGSNLHDQRKTKGSSFFSADFSYQWEDNLLTSMPAFAHSTAMEGLRLASSLPEFDTSK